MQKRSEPLPINGVILKVKTMQFHILLGSDNMYKASIWAATNNVCSIKVSAAEGISLSETSMECG